ncbi:MAG TPA: three-Cys-motif partner protein TcmP [Nakamurella sp.]
MTKNRQWGYWTEHKLDMLSQYLPAFTTASKGAGATVYLDLFAGAAQNTSRTTGRPIDGSPRIALATTPSFTKVVLFELPTQAKRLEADLRQSFPGRGITVYEGDCNRRIDAALAALVPYSHAATFALIDQFAAEVEWSTLAKLAAFKKARQDGKRYKVELWLLLAHSMLPRGLSAADYPTWEAFAARVDALYGTRDWAPIYSARTDDVLEPAELRRELVNLMRWRLERVLGYGSTHSFEMKNTNGSPIYTMIFATDNAAGDRIMSFIYDKAAKQRPKMQAEAAALMRERREEKAGILGLFPAPPKLVEPDKLYQHEPPVLPYGMSADG